MHPVIYYSIIFFIIGAVITLITNRKKSIPSRKKSWTKFFVYLLIVMFLLYSLIYNKTFRLALSGLVTLVGLLEITQLYFQTEEKSKRRVLFGLTILFYLLLSIGFISHIKHFTSNQLVFIFFIVFAFDGFSQIFGQLFGKRKILPRISPGKTVEGFIGGLIMSLIAGLSIAAYSQIRWDVAILMSLLFGLASFFGDMIASWIKRKYGVKDYSQLIPGHGGMLDRFDSWLMAGGFAYFLYLLGFIF